LQVAAFAKIGYTFYDGLHGANLLGNPRSCMLISLRFPPNEKGFL
jgi:hypothetical protein